MNAVRDRDRERHLDEVVRVEQRLERDAAGANVQIDQLATRGVQESKRGNNINK